LLFFAVAIAIYLLYTYQYNSNIQLFQCNADEPLHYYRFAD
jgi:hypothetical protein